jgi:flagella basal body P-ring formation protein FlgA
MARGLLTTDHVVNPLTPKVVPILTAFLLGFAALAAAKDNLTALQPLDSIRAAAERALRTELAAVSGVKLTAATLDNRLRLPACGAPLETHATAPRGSQSRALVRVACSQGASWTLNIPVEIRRELTVFVLRRALARDEALQAADVTPQKRVLPGLASLFLTRPEDLQGRLARRALPEGTALTADALTAAPLSGARPDLRQRRGNRSSRPGPGDERRQRPPASAGAEPRIAQGGRGNCRKRCCGPGNPLSQL